jgi:Right handed beta helix region
MRSGTNGGGDARRHAVRRWALWTVLLVITSLLATGLAGWSKLNRDPREVMRYLERRLHGHDKLERLALPLIHLVRGQIEKPVPLIEFNDNAGTSAASLPAQGYDKQGRPLPLGGVALPPSLGEQVWHEVQVLGVSALTEALRSAKAGDDIVLAAGEYLVSEPIELKANGTVDRPIRVRGARPGASRIRFNTTEGFHVRAPYWIFEDLVIAGVCRRHDDCEHAFHVVGAAHGTVIRNNKLMDFNAHIKVNGDRHGWPDNGLIQRNEITNTLPRSTERSVTPIDIVAASHWVVQDNRITDFVKSGGNMVAYGVFMKGGGRHGVIRNNHVVCSTKDISRPGIRVGLSFGGGGTAKAYCRDRLCMWEHDSGLMQGNLIEHCNDFGIYLNKASKAVLNLNQLINTAGILVRFPESGAVLSQNVLSSGSVRVRDGAMVHMLE